jgi:hypothetical protein
MIGPREIPDDPRAMPEPPLDEPAERAEAPERECGSCRRGDGGPCRC